MESTGGARRGFSGSVPNLHDAGVVGMCHDAFVKTHGMFNTKSVQCKLWTLVRNNVSILALHL